MATRRRVLALGAALVSAGCATTGPEPAPTGDPPATDPAGTDPGTPAPTTSPGPDGGDCVTATPRPLPDLSVTGDADEAVTATVTVRRASGATPAPTLYEETLDLAPGETVTVDDVLPDDDTYRVAVTVAGGTTETADVEAEPTRYGAVTVRVESREGVSVGWLHGAPPPTPTPCP